MVQLTFYASQSDIWAVHIYALWVCGPEVLFETCVAMKFVDDDDDDDVRRKERMNTFS